MFEASDESKYKARSGLPANMATAKVVKKAHKMFTKHPSTPVRIAAGKLKLARFTVSRIKVKALGITARIRPKAPNYSLLVVI